VPRKRERARLRADDREARRLRDQARVEAVVAFERRERAQAAVLLRRHAQQHHLGRRRAGPPQRGQRVQSRDHAALHVDRAAPVHAAAGDRTRPRPVAPGLVTGRDDVDMAVEAQAPGARAGQRDGEGHQLGSRRLLAGVPRIRAQGGQVVLDEFRLEAERLRSPGEQRERGPLLPSLAGHLDQPGEIGGQECRIDAHAVHVASSTRRQLRWATSSSSA